MISPHHAFTMYYKSVIIVIRYILSRGGVNMDSMFMRQQLMFQSMPQMTSAFAFAGNQTVPIGMMGMQPDQLPMAIATSAALGMAWGGYAGGASGMAGQYGDMGGFGAMAMAFSMSMPGPYAMVAIAMAGTSSSGMDNNTIEVAGTGMGQDKKYKMLPGEMLATYAVLKEKGNMSAEDMQKELQEKYGIDTEIKKEDGKSTLVNKSTGNVIMSDGNGNNIMETGDMKFKEAFEKLGLDMKDFEGKDGTAKLDYLIQGLNTGQGNAWGMSMGMGMGYNPFGNDIYGMNNSYGFNQYGNSGSTSLNGYPVGQAMGGMQQSGMMNDPRQMMMMMMVLMQALQYATMMQQMQGGGGYRMA
jgi:hypothetical protein